MTRRKNTATRNTWFSTCSSFFVSCNPLTMKSWWGTQTLDTVSTEIYIYIPYVDAAGMLIHTNEKFQWENCGKDSGPGGQIPRADCTYNNVLHNFMFIGRDAINRVTKLWFLQRIFFYPFHCGYVQLIIVILSYSISCAHHVFSYIGYFSSV